MFEDGATTAPDTAIAKAIVLGIALAFIRQGVHRLELREHRVATFEALAQPVLAALGDTNDTRLDDELLTMTQFEFDSARGTTFGIEPLLTHDLVRRSILGVLDRAFTQIQFPCNDSLDLISAGVSVGGTQFVLLLSAAEGTFWTAFERLSIRNNAGAC